MKADIIKGTGVALITPFNNDGKIDFVALGKLIVHVISGGVDFLVALGTTSEAPVLSADERNAVLNYIVKHAEGKIPVIVGVGGNNTQALEDTLKSMDFNGISGILSVAPYYNKPNQTGLYYHFKAISEASPVPIILYNVPGRTSSNITAATTLKLAAEFKNIVAIKEASGNFSQIMEIIHNKPEGFTVLSGDDALTYPMMAIGAEGVISVVANAYPQRFSKMVNYCLADHYKEARTAHYELLNIMEALFEDGNPAGVKAALEVMGIINNKLRLPLVKANEATFNKIKNLISELK